MALLESRPVRVALAATTALALAGCGTDRGGQSNRPTSAESAAPTTGLVVGPTRQREQPGPAVPTAAKVVDAVCTEQPTPEGDNLEVYTCPPGVLVQIYTAPDLSANPQLNGGMVVVVNRIGIGNPSDFDDRFEFPESYLRQGGAKAFDMSTENALPDGCEVVVSGRNTETYPVIEGAKIDC